MGSVAETLIYNPTVNFSMNPDYGLSIFFYFDSTVSVATNTEILNLGLTTSLTSTIARSGRASGLFGSLVSGTAAGEFQLASLSTANEVSESLSPVLSLDSGVYQLTGAWTLTGINTFDYSVRLFARGADGTGGAVELAGLSGSFSNSFVASAIPAYSGIFSGKPNSLVYIDNFAVSIPEPSFLTLFGLGSLILGAQWIRWAKAKI